MDTRPRRGLHMGRLGRPRAGALPWGMGCWTDAGNGPLDREQDNARPIPPARARDRIGRSLLGRPVTGHGRPPRPFCGRSASGSIPFHPMAPSGDRRGSASYRPPAMFVSRAGLKLAHALDELRLDVAGMVCADFGCNVGGFTDCLLQRGASRVVAIDTGYGTLAWKLRSDPRVETRERTNALHADPPAEGVDLVTIDLAWTPQRHAVPAGAPVAASRRPNPDLGEAALRAGGRRARLAAGRSASSRVCTARARARAGGDARPGSAAHGVDGLAARGREVEAPIGAGNLEYLALLESAASPGGV